MASVVRKCPEEGEIPCLCTCAALVAMQTKGLHPPGEPCPPTRSSKYHERETSFWGPAGDAH